MKRKFKIGFIFVMILACIAFTMSACGSSGSGSDSNSGSADNASTDASTSEATGAEANSAVEWPAIDKKDGERKVGAILMQGTNLFCQTWAKGIQDVVEGHGDEFVLINPEFDPLKQSSGIDDLVAGGANGVVIESLDGEGLVASVKAAKEKGVYVVSSDGPFSESNRDLIISEVMSDNVKAGEEIAQKLVDDLGEKGKIILLFYVGQQSGWREEGMRSVFDKYPGIEIVATGDGGANIEKSNAMMQNLMQAHPNLNAVIATCDDSAIGAMTALESAGRLKGVNIYGIDAIPYYVELLEDGKVTSTIAQDPYTMGKTAAEDLYKAFNGEDVGEKMKYIPTVLVDSSNASEHRSFYKSETVEPAAK